MARIVRHVGKKRYPSEPRFATLGAVSVERSRVWRIWLLPLLILLGFALAIFVLTLFVDSDGALFRIQLLWNHDPEVAHDAISNAGEVVQRVPS